MYIRKSTADDLAEILEIYAAARKFMHENGNPTQWTNNHPSREQIEQDIADGYSHVAVEGDKIAAVFSYIPGPDPTYAYIENGSWENESPYGVIHRIAAAEKSKGAGTFCIQWGLSQNPHMRIDTHKNNIPMQNMLKKNGFTCRGVIYLASGDSRIAFEKV